MARKEVFGRLQITLFRVTHRETGSNWWRSLRTSTPDHISLLSAFWHWEIGGRESYKDEVDEAQSGARSDQRCFNPSARWRIRKLMMKSEMSSEA